MRDPKDQVEPAVRILGQEALIQMLVPADDDVSAVLVERVPEGLHPRRLRFAMLPSGVVPGVVEVGDRAIGGVRREVGAQPDVLR